MSKPVIVAGTPALDPTLPDVVLKLGGVERTLCFDYAAIVIAERQTGVNLLAAAVGDVDATKLRGLLFAALLRDDPAITLDGAGALITPWNMITIHSAILTAWFGSVPNAEDTKDDPAPKTTAQAKAKKAKV